MKSSQLILKMAVLLALTALGINLYLVNKLLLTVWLIAMAAGFVLHRSGICFSGAFMDVILFRNYTIARALLIAIMVSLLGISSIQYFHLSKGLDVPGFIGSFGIQTAIGAFIFGIGMVFTGACGFGTLQRIGEGFSLYVVILLSIIIGSVIGAYHFSWWADIFVRVKPVYLPDIFGWPGGVLVSLTVLGSLYFWTLIADGSFSFQRGLGKWQKKG